jgi:1-phosphatidylinositol phosphodiesterase
MKAAAATASATAAATALNGDGTLYLTYN